MRIPTSQELNAIVQSLADAGMPAGNGGMQALLNLANENRIEFQPMSYTLSFVNLAAVTTAAAQIIKVDSQAPFMLISQEYWAPPYPVAVMTEATQLIPNCAVILQDLQSGRNWQDSATPVPSIFGTGQRPYFYPQPRLIAANSGISVTPNNFDAAQAYNLYLTFTGYRLFS